MTNAMVIKTTDNLEDMNMKRTVDEIITEFKKWVEEKIGVSEMMLKTNKGHLNYYLSRREPIDEDLFNSKFNNMYFNINLHIKVVKEVSERENIPVGILNDVIKTFKQMKSQVRKAKAEYKEIFAELRETINHSLDDTECVQKNEVIVGDVVREWCNTHEIEAFLKNHYEGERLIQEIHLITHHVMKTVAYPNENEIREIVEKYMGFRSVKRGIA
jgi:hypothetical protein